MATTSRSKWISVLRTPVGAAAAGLVLLVLLLALLGPPLWSDRATAMDAANLRQGASAAHWAGTDALGRDIFFRVLVACRLSVELALAATAIGVVIGLLLGAAPAMVGRRLGRFITAAINIAVAFPGLLLALFFAVIFGIGAHGAVLALGLATAPAFARLVQTMVAGIATRDYIAAARISGVGRMRLLVRHVLPNIGEPLAVNAMIGAGGALLAFAGLSFLGLGVQAPDYDWGRLLGEGLDRIYIHPAPALAPGIAVVIAGLAFNLLGEAIAKAIGMGPQTIIGGRRIRFRRRRPAAVGAAGGTAAGAALAGGAAAGTGAAGPAPDTAVPALDHDADAQDVDDPDVVLAVRDLRVSFPTATGAVTPVRGVNLTIRRGETVGVVGESGSGKSLTALAIAQLIERPGEVAAERLRFCGTDLLAGRPAAHRQRLGTSLALVFQDPMTTFNPTMRIGQQMAEVSREHHGATRADAMERAVDRLRAVRIPEARRRAHQFPHELSGGMRQRAMIGMGLMGDPALIIADEPTTALDATVQQDVLRLLAQVRRERDAAIVLISHDITVVRQLCDRVLVMYAGRIVEDLPAAELFHGTRAARHPYTRALLAAVPDMATDRSQPLAVIPGRPADPAHLPAGCAFAPRCPLATDICRRVDPALTDWPTDHAGGHRVACWHADQTDPVPDPAPDPGADRPPAIVAQREGP